MDEGFRDDSNPYQGVLQALLLLLQEDKEVVEKQIAQSVKMEEFRHD